MTAKPLVIPNRQLRRLSLPLVGLGCYFFGRDPAKRSQEIAFIRYAYRCGVRHFDVAKRYGSPTGQGAAESVVGEALSIFRRSSYKLVTKILPDELGPGRMEAAVRESLRRLRTRYVDVIMPHNLPEGGTTIKEMMVGLQNLKDKGLARAIGLSQFTLGKGLEAATEAAPGLVEYLQIRHNVGFRDFSADGTLAFCRQRGIVVVAYRPLYQKYLLFNRTIQAVAGKHGRTAAEVCLKWFAYQEGMVTIVGTTNLVHLPVDLGAACDDWELDAADLTRLDSIPRIDPSVVDAWLKTR